MRSIARTLAPLLFVLPACGDAGEAPAPGSSSEDGPDRVPAADPCEGVPATPDPGIGVEVLEGEYLLVVEAARGPAAGRRVEGTLVLAARDPSLHDVPGATGRSVAGIRAPLEGFATLDPAAVGARAPGSLESRDSEAPGALLLTRDEPETGQPGVLIRLGAEANRRDGVAFDGAFLVLHVRAWDADGFAGDWESGDGSVEGESSGTFCALRRP